MIRRMGSDSANETAENRACRHVDEMTLATTVTRPESRHRVLRPGQFGRDLGPEMLAPLRIMTEPELGYRNVAAQIVDVPVPAPARA